MSKTKKEIHPDQKNSNIHEEQKPENIKRDLINEYLQTRKQGKSALVISPTRGQLKALNKDIRENLRDKKYIGKII